MLKTSAIKQVIKGDGLIQSSLTSLLAQQSSAAALQRGKQKIRASQAGQHLSVYKGRGMDFAESRAYVPGDDIRAMDWKVTARTGLPHTKIFQEERERPVLVWTDLRPDMFFATRGRFKSVMAAEIASLLIWKSWLDGDRAGGMVVGADQQIELRPARTKAKVLQLLQTIADYSQALFHTAGQRSLVDTSESLAASWRRLQRVTSSGSQVTIISDFRGLNEAAEKQLLSVSRQAALTLIRISDPFELQLPDPQQMAKKGFSLSDGQRFLRLNFANKTVRSQHEEINQQLDKQLTQLANRTKATLVNILTSDDDNQRVMKLVRGVV
ncbi:MAG: DUF58 domain-containing protein [Cocleimonas sp.]|nr:DUF58 domain-containing protein [Cocleimonas sp.]